MLFIIPTGTGNDGHRMLTAEIHSCRLSLSKSQYATAVIKGKAFNGHCVSMWLLRVFPDKHDIDLESHMICT